LQLSPVTSDVEEAEEWLEAFKASGVEGLVVKGASTRYQPGRRDWAKVNSVGVGGPVGSPMGRILGGQEAGRRSMAGRATRIARTTGLVTNPRG
jgi:hypothetical protein